MIEGIARRSWTWTPVSILFALTACGTSGGSTAPSSDGGGASDASDGGGAPAFVGKWTCTSGAPLVVTAPPAYVGTYMASSNAYVLQISSSSDGSLTVVIEASDGGVFCTKKATLTTPTTATFAGQTCPQFFNGTMLTETFTTGTFTLSGNSMTDLGSGAVTGNVPFDGGAGSFIGTIDFDGMCTRQ